jgi:2-hydroxy-6-oxonona-2,4-dienedioate hydrolase
VLLRDRYQQRWINVDGINTRYFDEGRGLPVVFLHGGGVGDPIGASNAEDWSITFPPAASRYNAITLDRLGQGYTDNPKTDDDYTIGAAVEHVIAFLEKLGKGPYHLVGHSRGGYVACTITLTRPDLVASCFMIDSATSAPGMERNPYVFATNPHPRRSREAALYCYERYSYSTDHMDDEWIDDKFTILQLPKTKVAVEKMYDEALMRTTFWPGLRADREKLHIGLMSGGLLRPTMLTWAAQDPTAPISHGYVLFNMLCAHQPNTQMHVVNRAGHFSQREQPAVYERVIAEFLDSVVEGV